MTTSTTTLLSKIRLLIEEMSSSAKQGTPPKHILAKINPHPRDAQINFIKKGHQYEIKNSKVKYVSVSSVINPFCEGFRSNFYANKLAENPSEKYAEIVNHLKSEKLSTPEIANFLKKIWNAKANQESSRGTIVHSFCEIEMNLMGFALFQKLLNLDSRFSPSVDSTASESDDTDEVSEISFSKPLTPTLHNFLTAEPFSLHPFYASRVLGTAEAKPTFIPEHEIQLFRNWFTEFVAGGRLPFRTEWSIFNEFLMIAGQLDGLFYSEINDSYVLTDWKRVCDLTDEPDSKARKFKPPFDQFSELQDTKFGKYVVQLNLYRLILKLSYHINVEEMWLLQLHPSLEKAIEIRVPCLNLGEFGKAVLQARYLDPEFAKSREK